MSLKSDNSDFVIDATGVGSDVVFKNDGVEITRASILKDAGSSLATNGYQKLPSGLIIQWVEGTSVITEGTQTITFPIAFTTAVLQVLVSTRAVNVASDGIFQTGSTTLTNVTVVENNLDVGTAARTPVILAIGY